MGGFDKGNSEQAMGNSFYSLFPIAYCLSFRAASAAK